MPNPAYPRPVVPLLIALIAGIVSGVWFPGLSLPACPVILLSIGAIGYALFRGKSYRMSPLFPLFALGYLPIQPYVAPRFPSHHVIHYADGQKREITGTIASPPIATNHRIRFVP